MTLRRSARAVGRILAATARCAPVACLLLASALVGCTPERGAELGADPTAEDAAAAPASAPGCASPRLYCVAVVSGPDRPLAGSNAVEAAVDALEVDPEIDVEVRRFELADAERVPAVLTSAIGTAPDLVVVLPGQGVEPHVLDSVVRAAEAWPESRFVTVAPIDEAERLLGVQPSSDAARSLTLDNLAVVGFDPARWAVVAADALALVDADAAGDVDAPDRVGLIVGTDLDPAATTLAGAFADALDGRWMADIAQHPGALDGSSADAEWDATATAAAIDDGAIVVVADVDGLEGAEVPCIVLGPRPDPAPGCAVAVADPGIDVALEFIVVRRRQGTGPSGLVVAEPTMIAVARAGD